MTTEVLERPTAMAEINMAHAAAALAEDYAQDADLPLRYAYTWQHLNRGRYAEQVLRRGPLRCVDPIDGTLRSATSAHVLCGDWLGIIYHFEGVEPFWLVTSSFDQAKLGLYLPRREVFIAGPVDPNWVTIGHDAVRSHLRLAATAEPWTGPVKPEASVLYLGFCNNLGHTMWNDLSGLEAAVDAGMLDRVAAVVAGPHTFFPVDEQPHHPQPAPPHRRVGVAGGAGQPGITRAAERPRPEPVVQPAPAQQDLGRPG